LLNQLIKAGLAIAAMIFLGSVSACALDPVEADPAKAEARYSALREDCFRRGGTWSEDSRVCLGADNRR
jgi:hypothetical protein